jgi:hypothetical protein
MTATVPGVGGTFTLSSSTGWTFTATPFVVVVDRGLATEEKILCSAIAGTTVTVGQRGFDGTSGQIHGAAPNNSIMHILDSVTVDELNAGLFYALLTPITVRGFASQSVDLQQWQDSTPVILARVQSDGSFVSNGTITGKLRNYAVRSYARANFK